MAYADIGDNQGKGSGATGYVRGYNGRSNWPTFRPAPRMISPCPAPALRGPPVALRIGAADPPGHHIQPTAGAGMPRRHADAGGLTGPKAVPVKRYFQ